MDTQQAIRLVRRFADLVRDQFPVRKVILYGSHARGTAHEYNDIDVAVLVDRIEGDLLDIETTLFRLGRGIDFRIEPVPREEGHARAASPRRSSEPDTWSTPPHETGPTTRNAPVLCERSLSFRSDYSILSRCPNSRSTTLRPA